MELRKARMLYRIEKTDVHKAASLLGRSFINYPIFTHIIPDNNYRTEKISLLFSFLIRNGLQTGEVLAPSKNIEGVSIWIPHYGKSPKINVISSGMIGLLLRLDNSALQRFIKVGREKERMRLKIINKPFCLLDVIGVDPQFQRKGFARIMLQPKLNELDSKKIPCYLETSDIANVPMYENYGFTIINKYMLFETEVFCMLK
jgi:hypothetical protein